jgi:hypothetical protein
MTKKPGKGKGGGGFKEPPPDKDPERAIAAIDKLVESLGGVVSPRDVVDAAKSEVSPLHPYFEWDDTVAAEKFRLGQARNLLRIRIDYQDLPNNSVMTIPLYSSAWPMRGEGKRSYQKTITLLSEEDYTDRLALDCLKRALSQLTALPHAALEDAQFALVPIRKALERKLYGDGT